jgi:hypothetical protein
MAVLFWISCPGCPVLAVIYFLPWLSYSGSPVLAALSWQPCPDIVRAVLFCLSCSACPVCFPVSLGLSRSDSTILAVPIWLRVLAVLLRGPCYSCPLLSFLLCLPYARFPILASLSGNCPGSPVLATLSWQSCSACPILPVLFCPSFSACPDLPVLFCMFCYACSIPCSACPALPVLLFMFLAVLFWLSYSGCLVLDVLSWLSYPCCLYSTSGKGNWECETTSTKIGMREYERGKKTKREI